MDSRIVRAGVVLFLAIIMWPAVAFAQQTSPNYEIDEVFIGGGGQLDACSTNFCSDQSVGGTAVGNSSSANFQSDAGFGSPDTPYLEVDVTNYLVDLGVLNTSSTSAASANFSVRNYLSNGYIVRIYGDSPTNVTGPGTTSLTALNSPSLSQPGTEQFGINLVANTTPGIGVNPVQDSEFASGEAAPGYDTPDYFKYLDGDIIALSDIESGQTAYTMSIIANIATSTAGGQYKTTLVVQVIASF